MDHNIIDAINRAGFAVYMRDEKDSYLLFTDGTNIGYLQEDRSAGLSLGTVHIPNTRTGTGFGVAQGLTEDDLTNEVLSRAFVHAPDWAGSDRNTVVKWKDISHHGRANSFNAGYKLISNQKDA
jgi:hypothetical protein